MPSEGRKATHDRVDFYQGTATCRCGWTGAQGEAQAHLLAAGRDTTPEHVHPWADPCTEMCPAHDPAEFADDVPAGREATPTTPGMYAEQSAGGWAVWLVDEDGDWHEMSPRGEVLDAAECTYYRLVEVTDV